MFFFCFVKQFKYLYIIVLRYVLTFLQLYNLLLSFSRHSFKIIFMFIIKNNNKAIQWNMLDTKLRKKKNCHIG